MTISSPAELVSADIPTQQYNISCKLTNALSDLLSLLRVVGYGALRDADAILQDVSPAVLLVPWYLSAIILSREAVRSGTRGRRGDGAVGKQPVC